MRNYFALLICILFLAGCPGPLPGPDVVDPDDGPVIVIDENLVNELVPMFGQIGRSDARTFGNFYVAFADYLETEQGQKFDDFVKVQTFGADVREILGVAGSDYPQFKVKLETILSEFSNAGPISQEDRKRYCAVFRNLGYALRKVGSTSD